MVSTSIELSAGVGVAEASRGTARPMLLSGRLGHEERSRRARRWLALDAVYVGSAMVALTIAAGEARVMQAAVLVTAVSLIGPLGWIVAARLERRPATCDHPAGLQRLSAVVMLGGALIALIASAWLLVDGVGALLAGAGGRPGGGALAAALSATVPAMALARIKRQLGDELRDHALHADAVRDALSWRIPAAVGFAVVGVAAGAWWADASAAILLGAELGHDGARHLRASVDGLLGCLPRRTDLAGLDPVLGVILAELAGTAWVTGYDLRLREHGAQIAGEILVDIPEHLPAVELVALTERLHRADWRLTPVTVAARRAPRTS